MKSSGRAKSNRTMFGGNKLPIGIQWTFLVKRRLTYIETFYGDPLWPCLYFLETLKSENQAVAFSSFEKLLYLI